MGLYSICRGPRFNELFNALDYCEDLLSKQRYLVENTLTEADWRLFTTLI